jgi:DNA recombination protein RmuC
MFVPTDGLYAEIVRRTALFEMLQRECRVTVVGPTNLVAFLNSLQMGFRTLAIEKRSSEVWVLLAAVKTEFGKFEGVLDKVKGKLDAASRELDKVGTRSRVITRKLRKVQELPAQDSSLLLGDGDTGDGDSVGGDAGEGQDDSDADVYLDAYTDADAGEGELNDNHDDS